MKIRIPTLAALALLALAVPAYSSSPAYADDDGTAVQQGQGAGDSGDNGGSGYISPDDSGTSSGGDSGYVDGGDGGDGD
jgi:hypothetical protein